ncbi:hypothetical protein NK718_18775 [Alsobacter sp. SYSU M60028]|uniref:DUF6894 domain-containing protein n=1 Tax=Alsobacter ponti TaxID=2962936 RepID=A0ABT1LGE2_9HYPH|nr:hypothetical protein [Alsobacter ponti]MCP8940574.1 hypothetical protein [Alsobacter ponti]
MPRYFFNLSIDGRLLPDTEGQELPDADRAWEAARKAARSLMRSKVGQSVNWLTSSFEVRDEDGEIVLEFPFLEAIDIEGGKPN